MSLIKISKLLLFTFIFLSIINLGCTETNNKENNEEIQQVKLENKQMTQPSYEYEPPKGFLNKSEFSNIGVASSLNPNFCSV